MPARPELPVLCDDATKEHRWAEVSVHGCGYNSGDHAVDESFVLPRFVERPLRGCVCNDCFQVWGEAKGTRDPALVAAFIALSSW